MKRWIAGFAALCLLLTVLPGAALARADKISVVTTIFPIYDWVRQVMGEDAEHMELTMLLDSGVDLHSFQPTARDIMKIATCDVFIYVGGESDEWVEDALAEAVNPNLIVVNLMDELGENAKEEETVEGMEAEEEEEEGEEETEYDEHIWLSLHNARLLCGVIAEKLAEADPDCAEEYRANAAAYDEKLSALDGEYAQMVSSAETDTLLFGDRFPFRYLVDDYGLSYYAAFSGCSAETEASFETVVFLAKKVDELGLGAVMTIEGTTHRIAETIVENTQDKDQKILALNSMQGITGRDVDGGVTYLSVMESNLDVLKNALTK